MDRPALARLLADFDLVVLGVKNSAELDLCLKAETDESYSDAEMAEIDSLGLRSAGGGSLQTIDLRHGAMASQAGDLDLKTCGNSSRRSLVAGLGRLSGLRAAT
jgi:hypothetical protein